MTFLMDKLRAWGISRDILMLGLARMIDSAGASLLIILIPRYVEHLQLVFLGLPEAFLIGILLSTFGITNFLVQPSAGILLDRFGRHRPFLLIGLGLYAVCTVLLIWSKNAPGIFAIRVTQGFGVALTIPATLSLITTFTEPRERGTAMGFYNMMRMTGFSVGPLLGGSMIELWGFGVPILFAAVTAGIGVILIFFMVREPPGKPAVDKQGYLEAFAAYLSPKMIDFLKIAFGNMAMAMSISIISSLQNEYNEMLNQTTFEFSIAFSALLFSMILVQLPIGRLADRYGRKIPIVGGLVLLAPITVWMGYVGSTTQLVVARTLQGITVAAVFAPSVALGGDKSDAGTRGRQLSLIGMSFVLGIGIGPAMGGLFAGYFPFSTPFWIGAVLSLAGAGLIAFTVPETVLREEEN